MDCADVRQWIDAHTDGELDLPTSLAVEQHLAGCPDCTRRFHNRRLLRDALQADTLAFKAPATLRQQIRASIGDQDQAGWIDRVEQRLRQSRWIGLAAAFMIGVLLTAGLLPRLSAPDSFTLLAQQVVASHIRSLMVNHLSDVASTDQHTVKPWFDGKLDFSPVVVDPASQGFPLIGGRLDYLDNRSVTALVYQRQKHIINLFEWPASGAADSALDSVTLQGYHLLHWVKSSVSYWAVSDLELSELQAFVQLLQSQPAVTPPA